ncbi:MAG: hypothetical protein AMJ62_07215 [Myxococcales bacterium SG8_38]|nr:MAG: hypothetical protein AMJ62_07215 [Myxococcales bacterium SG8_38]
MAAWVLLTAAPASASAGSVLLAPLQGSDALGASHAEPVANAVRRALGSRGHLVADGEELWGQAVVDFWSRQRGGAELTLTLVQRSGRNLNVSTALGTDASQAATALVDMLLMRQAASSVGPDRSDAAASEAAHPHAWKAGPIVLIAAGSAAFVAIGVAAGVQDDGQQLDGAAVGAWSAVGAAAVAGGIAWWVVGKKRRRPENSQHDARGATVGFQPARIDLRLRF